jgi:cytochrome c-type biogenesis protein CcsB
MANLSHSLLFVAIIGYLFAMMGYAAEYAFGARGAVARVATRTEAPVLVGAGGIASTGDLSSAVDFASTDDLASSDDFPSTVDFASTDDLDGPPADRLAGWAPIAGRVALVLTVIGLLAHVGCLVTRGFAAHRVPWGNMYEFIIAVTLVASIAWMVLVTRRPSIRPLGLFVTGVLVVLLGLDETVLYTKVSPLVPALNSYWLKIHVTLAITASGILMLGFCAAVLHLIRAGYEKRTADEAEIGFPYTLGERLQPADSLERLTFRIHAFAFPIWTLAIICGAIWAEAAWGRYWGWDPKETWAFIAWVAYACYLHARATPSVRRTTASWLAVVGWGTMMMNLFIVNIFITGLHSYAGVGK